MIYPIPDEAIVELLVDNLAASRSYEGCWSNGKSKDGWLWMTEYYDQYRMHPDN
jgi:hypothetical protein